MLIDETVAIFIAATTGQGVEPDNMRRFWRFLMRKSLPSDSLSSLKYAVFGTWITVLAGTVASASACAIMPLVCWEDYLSIGHCFNACWSPASHNITTGIELN